MASSGPLYEIGYGKPPKSGRFQKGRSGNPRGRPKRMPSFGERLEKAMRQRVGVNEQGRRKLISLWDLMFKQIANKAASGDRHFIQLALAYIGDIDLMRGGKCGSGEPDIPVDLTTLSDEELSALYFERIQSGF
jgi:hypothetical protein